MPGQIVSGQLLVTSNGVMSSFRRSCLRGALMDMWCAASATGTVENSKNAVHNRAIEKCCVGV